MSDTIKVMITATAEARFSKEVNMQKEDYDKYLQICEAWTSAREVDEQIKDIAVKYGFYGDGEDIEDISDPEEIEFEIVK